MIRAMTTERIYAVGDIHGQRGMLEDALARIEADGGAGARVVFLGDYVDRGPDSAGVIETLSRGAAEGRDWVFLMGNHDRMFRWFMESPPRQDAHLLVGYHWFHDRIGGRATMASYGVGVQEGQRLKAIRAEAQPLVPQAHLSFLDDLRLWHREGGLLFVHAGIRPGVALADQDPEDLVWIRDEFHAHPDPHPWLVVHGHTPVQHATHSGNRVNLDTGAGYGDPLTVAVFEGGGVWALTRKGRVALKPRKV